MIRKIIKCQKGESDFPWFFVLIGIPVLISMFGDDDKDKKDTDTTDKETKVIVEKVKETTVAIKKETQKMIDTAKNKFEKDKEKKVIVNNPDPFADGVDKFKSNNERIF